MNQFLKGHEHEVCSIVIAPSGNKLASGENPEDPGFHAALIVWDFYSHEMLYRVKYHKDRIVALSFSCDDTYLLSLGSLADGNNIIVWNMDEGRSECQVPASNKAKELCNDLKFFNKDPSRFVSVHDEAMKVWFFDSKAKKAVSTDCALGHVKRYINCVTVDPTDTFAYCGTRTGDILEIYLDKAAFKRIGPVNRVFMGGIQGILSSPAKEILICSGDGTLAKISKKTMKLMEETKLKGGLKSMTTNDTDKLFLISSRSIMYHLDLNEINIHEHLLSTHSKPIKDISFPAEYSAVFATCAGNDIRVWNVAN
jgi:WD40 repeat protein